MTQGQHNTFPGNPTDNAFWQGLTKREYFAAMALQGYLANSVANTETKSIPNLAEWATLAADALINALNK